MASVYRTNTSEIATIPLCCPDCTSHIAGQYDSRIVPHVGVRERVRCAECGTLWQYKVVSFDGITASIEWSRRVKGAK